MPKAAAPVADEPVAKKPKYTVPKKPADVADRWFEIMQERLALGKQIAALEAEEKFLKAHLIDTLPAGNATGISGRLVTVLVERKDRAEISDYDAFVDYIAKNKKKGAFALLNRAVNAASVKEYWDQGKDVPGITKVQYKTLSYSRR